tara:strand:- start:82 stop:561 length:480 start_codon:yes stop_codon:yes gene_type:complete
MNNLANSIAKILTEKKLTLSTAESCSAGGLSLTICSVPGSSIYFLGGVIAYSNKSKHRELNVNSYDLRKYSEVSEVVAKQMSIGVKNRFGSDFSIATTGYAGPKGDSVGKVFISISTPKKTIINEYLFRGTREEITSQIIENSLQNLNFQIKSFVYTNK